MSLFFHTQLKKYNLTSRVERNDVTAPGAVWPALEDGAGLVHLGLAGLGGGGAHEEPEKIENRFYSETNS